MHTQLVMHSPHPDLRMYTNGGYNYVCTGTPKTNSKIYLINQPKLNTNDAHSTGASPHPDLRMYTNGGYMRVQVHPTLTAQKNRLQHKLT